MQIAHAIRTFPPHGCYYELNFPPELLAEHNDERTGLPGPLATWPKAWQ
jgi:hypothetical protein